MNEKILVVDDNDEIRDIVSLYLKNSNFEVYEAKNGKEALDFLKNNKISLMILDIMMPEVDGIEVLKAIGNDRDFPIIFLSAKSSVKDKIEGLYLGADDYLAKPFDPGELVARVIALLRRSNRKLDNNIVKIGNLSWDKDKRLVYKDDNLLTLRSKEYELLTLFMTTPGKVFTKQEIYENLWQEYYFEDDNTIMVHISNLREKIEDNSKSPAKIITIRGLGYMLRKE
ncbi:response regulator transcription factor [uncultured Anaerococcus sp.]|uniref:response regulator transcription factor n=1 Tax=Anaerococcus sp. AH8042_DFU013_CI05 TaxID=3385202 RepID=UPI0025E97701|nr:response regulator transcription factor [uncultured Anaerococcus sp.]